MASKQQPVMEWTGDHDILLLHEMIARELFQFKKGSQSRPWQTLGVNPGKIEYELDNRL